MGNALRHAGAAVGADHRVRLRVILWLGIAAGCVALAPLPFGVIGVIALLLAAVEWSHLTRRIG